MSTSTGTTIETTIADFYTTILARTGSAAEIQSWASVVESGAVTLDQVENAFIVSPEAQQSVVPIVEIYQAELGRAPDAAGLAAWVGAEGTMSLAQIAAAIANSTESQALYGVSTDVNTAFLTALYQTVLGRAPDTAGLDAWLNSGETRAQIEYAFATSAEAVARAAPAADAFLASVSQGGAYGGSLYAAVPGGTFTLTTGQDNIAPTGNSNTINGTANGSTSQPATFNAGDTITGAAGSTGNVLNLADIHTNGTWSTATNLAGVTVSDIQTLNLNSAEGVTANTASSIEGFTGLTALNVNDAGHTSVTAAGSTDVSVTNSRGAVTVIGANNVTISSAGGAIVGGGTTATDPAGSVTITDASFIGVRIDGGTTINVTETDGSAITIGDAVAPMDTVTVTDSSDPTTSSTTLGPIDVTGGTVVNVTENELGQVGSKITGGDVNVFGTTSTTSVSVTQTAAANQSQTVTGVSDGQVFIHDVNGNGPTEAGTITSVSLSNYSSGATIVDNALADLTLAGTGGGVAIVDNLPTATTLNLSVNSLTDTAGIIDANNEITTLNVTTDGTSASTLGLFEDSGLTTLNISGTQAFNLGVSPSTLTAINVSGGASLSNGLGFGYALGADTAFTSTSTGTDVVSISGPATKTVTGNSSAEEEIVWNGTSAPAAATGYLGKVTGFSVLGIGSAVANETFDMSKLTGFTGFDVEGNLNPGIITLTNVTAGSPLAIDGEFDGTLVYQTADTAGATDSLAVTLGAAANQTGFAVGSLILEDSQLDGIGSLTVTSNASGASEFNTITTLHDGSLSTLNVAGTAGLFIANSFATNATSLTINGTSTGTEPVTLSGVNDKNLATLNLSGTDAIALGSIVDGTAGVTVNGTADDANVSFDLGGATASGKIDSITLGNGNNSVSDTAALAGATVKIAVGTGSNTITLGDATNTVTFKAHSTTTADSVSVSGAVGATIVPSATITGLNVAGADTITFLSDLNATGPITTYTASQINSFGATPPATLADAVAGVLAGGNLAQHGIGEFQFQNNTYFVDQANATGSAFTAGDTVVKLAGLDTFTTATNANNGVLHLVG
jgi:S-layer protein